MMNVRRITLDGHTIAVAPLSPETAGAPIVLLHSVLASPAQWLADPVFRHLGQCYALSLPGHYPGAFPPKFKAEQLTPELMAQVLSSAIRQIAEQPVLLVGFSTGAFAALAIAAYAPELVRSVVSISGFVQGRWGGTLGRLQRLARGGVPGRLAFWAAMRLYNRQLDPRAMRAYCQVMPDTDIQQLLTRITAPTLVLAGERDPIVSPEQSRLIARLIAQAQLVVLPDAGHNLFGAPGYQDAVHSWLSVSGS